MVKSDLISEPERVQVHILRMIIINAHLNYHAIIGDSAPSSAQSHLPPQAVSECKTETSTVADEADDDENDQYEHECVECGDYTMFSHKPSEYLPLCLSDKCLLQLLRETRSAHEKSSKQ